MSRLSRLPSFISHWLGHRSTPVDKHPDYIVYFWSFVGSFLGISLIQAVFGHAHYFIERGVPSIVASYGATAVLIYGAIEVPLSQPRCLFGGHFLGALVGICITKLFHLLPTEERFENLLWLAASLSCSLSIVIMQLTGTTHPPAGATAVLASLNPEIRQMGWYYLPVILLTSTLVLVVALIVNNIHRRFPVFWIKHTPPPPPTESSTPTLSPSETLTDERVEKKGGETVTELPV